MYNASTMALRMTFQTKQVLQAAQQLGHATNSDILVLTRKTLPDISATTVHRITNRLVENGLLKFGPDIGGSMIIDSNTDTHDHFVCKQCQGILDIKVDTGARTHIQKQVPNLYKGASLTITGDCNTCH
jgi:Fe2+ or Zn2+ uptake regulation protein